jgi:hypothetical protein
MYFPTSQPSYSLPGHRPILIPRGMGALTGQTASIAQAAQAGADTTAAALVTLGVVVPGVGTIIAGLAAVGIALANIFSGCGQTCVEASDLANQAEPLLLQNLETYLSAPVHYQSLRAAALNNFQLTWNALVSACSNPALGSAGQSCISNRQQGACQWQASPGGWQQQNGVWTYVPWGPAGSGSSCWNWFIGYHDPIANDPTVVPNPLGVSSTSGNCLSILTPFGLPDPCISPIPVGLGTIALIAALAFFI